MQTVNITKDVTINLGTVSEAKSLLDVFIIDGHGKRDVLVNDVKIECHKHMHGSWEYDYTYDITYVDKDNNLIELKNVTVDHDHIINQINSVLKDLDNNRYSFGNLVKVTYDIPAPEYVVLSDFDDSVTIITMPYNDSYLELIVASHGGEVIGDSIEAHYNNNVYKAKDIGLTEDNLFRVNLTSDGLDDITVEYNVLDLLESFAI